jgi:transketolase
MLKYNYESGGFLTDLSELERHARNIRIKIIQMLAAAGSGHPAGALGLADIYAALWFEVLHYNPADPHDPMRDLFVISNGHTVPVFYATLAEVGLIPAQEIYELRKFESRLQGHPERERLPWLETTSGPLGEGLSQAAGMAYALKNWPGVTRKNIQVCRPETSASLDLPDIQDPANPQKNAWIPDLSGNQSSRPKNEQVRFSSDSSDYQVRNDKAKNPRKVFCMLGDGELDEGENWEAIMFAAKNHLNNLIAIVDYNQIQLSGPIREVMPLADLAAKWHAFNWNVIEIDGNDMNEILFALNTARGENSGRKVELDCAKPTVIIAKTVPGQGVSFMENDYTWHGKSLSAEDAKKALAELNGEKS